MIYRRGILSADKGRFACQCCQCGLMADLMQLTRLAIRPWHCTVAFFVGTEPTSQAWLLL